MIQAHIKLSCADPALVVKRNELKFKQMTLRNFERNSFFTKFISLLSNVFHSVSNPRYVSSLISGLLFRWQMLFNLQVKDRSYSLMNLEREQQQ